jgi:creatinine amidohydrolase
MKTKITLLFFLVFTSISFSQDLKTYKFADLNWMEIQKLVPGKFNTVLIAAGTVEAHGVTSNSTDIIIPDMIALKIAPEINGLVAPAIPYGATRSLNYPGGIPISDETLTRLYFEVLNGLHENGFRNIIVMNGHGPNRALLEKAAEKLYLEKKARILIIDWWSYTEKISLEIYKDRGGHAGSNETGAVLAIDPSLVKKDLYKPELALPTNKTYSAYPQASSIIIYDEGKGYPDFDEQKAKKFFSLVCQEIKNLIINTIKNWDNSGL